MMKKLVSVILILFSMGILSSCDEVENLMAGLGMARIEGTYTFDYNGYEQKVIISSNKTTGPCTYIAAGEPYKESYHVSIAYDRPVIDITNRFYIDYKNKMIYLDIDDFRAYRDGIRCTRR